MYRIFDCLLDSNIPLPELPEEKNHAADITFSLQNSPLIPENISWQHHWESQGAGITISFGYHEDGYCLRFPGIVDIFIQHDCRHVDGFAEKQVDHSSIRHVLLDQVLPRMLSHRGELVLHASAVLHENGALVFLGKSGSGKSTLSSSLSQRGLALLSDDCLLLRQDGERVDCIPAYSGSRLWRDSFQAVVNGKGDALNVIAHSGKIRLNEQSKANEIGPFPVKAVFIISEQTRNSGSINIKSARGIACIIALIKSSFLLDVHDKTTTANMFQKMASILESDMQVFELAYPHDYERLIEVHEAVMHALD